LFFIVALAGLLQEHGASLIEEENYGGVERIEGLAEPCVKLVAALLNGLGHRRPHAALLIAQTEQANSRPTQQRGVYR